MRLKYVDYSVARTEVVNLSPQITQETLQAVSYNSRPMSAQAPASN
jgi:hypothetical protein